MKTQSGLPTLPDDARGLLLGQTGTGKSTLAKILLVNKPSLLVIDPKHQFTTIQEYTITDNPERVPMLFQRSERKKIAVIYRPLPGMTKSEEIDRIYKWAFYRGNIFIYNDELTGVVLNHMRYPEHLRAIYTMGRSKNIGTLGATQRPSMLPLFIFSESEYFWVFYLHLRTDRERAEEFIIPSGVEYKRNALDWHNKHSFYYHELGDRNFPREIKLNLTGTELAGIKT